MAVFAVWNGWIRFAGRGEWEERVLVFGLGTVLVLSGMNKRKCEVAVHCKI